MNQCGLNCANRRSNRFGTLYGVVCTSSAEKIQFCEAMVNQNCNEIMKCDTTKSLSSVFSHISNIILPPIPPRLSQ